MLMNVPLALRVAADQRQAQSNQNAALYRVHVDRLLNAVKQTQPRASHAHGRANCLMRALFYNVITVL